MRGVITKVGRKVLKVLIIPAAAALLDKPVEKIVGLIERKHRHNVIWSPAPDTFTKAPSGPFRDWKNLASGTSLLIIHGILSSAEGMLSKLPQSAMEEFYSRYGGRVIAFNHLSVTETPDENAQWLLEQLKQASSRTGSPSMF